MHNRACKNHVIRPLAGLAPEPLHRYTSKVYQCRFCAGARVVLGVFAANLRLLCEKRGVSQAQAARDLDLGKVQFQRFLRAESFPKPNLLQKICRYFDTDARILTEALHTMELVSPVSGGGGISGGWAGLGGDPLPPLDRTVAETLALCMRGNDYGVSQAELPDGLYRHWSADGVNPDAYYCIPCQIGTRNGTRLMRAYHGRWLFPGPRSPDLRRRRKFRGMPLKVPDGFIVMFFHAAPFARITMMHLRSDAMLIEGGYVGFAAYARPEMAGFVRAARCYLEKVPQGAAGILACARLKPMMTGAELPPLIHDHLRLPFA